jgi:hypothetical protein
VARATELLVVPKSMPTWVLGATPGEFAAGNMKAYYPSWRAEV